MAKQSGLHQIRGKVGEHSYYKQTGVASGLIRSINQGLSSRVKNGEEYANTRLNMQEFGQACQIAGQLGKMVSPKFRPMVLPFSQSKMAKDILALIKADTTSPVVWGWRGLMPAKFVEALASLNAIAKYPFDNAITDVIVSSSTTESSLYEDWSAEIYYQTGFDDFLTSINANGVFIKAIAVSAAYTAPNFASDIKGQLNARAWRDQTGDATFGDTDMTINLTNILVPVNPDANFHRTIVVVTMPYRKVGTDKHILQEYCSFKAFEVPEP